MAASNAPKDCSESTLAIAYCAELGLNSLKNKVQRDAQILFFEGTEFLQLGNVKHAEACFRLALSLSPNFTEAHVNLGLALCRLGLLVEAEACYHRALVLDNMQALAYANLADLLANQKRFLEAESAYKESLHRDEKNVITWNNLGALYACMERELDAERCYRLVLEVDKDHRAARFNLSYLLLRNGQFDEGFGFFEYRDSYLVWEKFFTCPRWRGDDLHGKTIVIAAEGGHGDMIQFIRYATLLKARGARSITVICQPALQRLFCSMPDLDEAICYDGIPSTSQWDCWVPILSLPFCFGTEPHSIPNAIPYIVIHRLAVDANLGHLPKKNLRVGLVWKGNPQFENDVDRSLPSHNVLAPLWGVEGVHFFNLQRPDEAQEPECIQLPIISMERNIQDFYDLATIMQSLDIVIAVDTAAAHLAGALGIPCWIMLPAYKNDWRWQKKRTDSPWYPKTTTLFRQTKSGDWSDVVAELLINLATCSATFQTQNAAIQDS